jgi:hypothetical protein
MKHQRNKQRQCIHKVDPLHRLNDPFHVSNLRKDMLKIKPGDDMK